MNPSWYCKEIEFRAVREDDRYEIGCDCCGFKDELLDRRCPKDSTIIFWLERGCTCE